METKDIRKLVAFFYADDGLVAFRDAATLQKVFEVLTGFFCVGLHTNTTKTEVMSRVVGRIRTPLDEDAYEARISYLHRAERKGREMECLTCGEPLAVGLLRSHLASQHDQYQYFLAPTVEYIHRRGTETQTVGRRGSTRRTGTSGALCSTARKGKRGQDANPLQSALHITLRSATQTTR